MTDFLNAGPSETLSFDSASPSAAEPESPLPGASSASDGFPYLRQIARIPVLSRSEQGELAARIRERVGGFRAHVLAIPGAADAAVARWREIKDEGRVSGTLSAGYRDGSGVHQVVKRLEQRAKTDPTLASHLQKPFQKMSSVKR